MCIYTVICNAALSKGAWAMPAATTQQPATLLCPPRNFFLHGIWTNLTLVQKLLVQATRVQFPAPARKVSFPFFEHASFTKICHFTSLQDHEYMCPKRERSLPLPEKQGNAPLFGTCFVRKYHVFLLVWKTVIWGQGRRNVISTNFKGGNQWKPLFSTACAQDLRKGVCMWYHLPSISTQRN